MSQAQRLEARLTSAKGQQISQVILHVGAGVPWERRDLKVNSSYATNVLHSPFRSLPPQRDPHTNCPCLTLSTRFLRLQPASPTGSFLSGRSQFTHPLLGTTSHSIKWPVLLVSRALLSTGRFPAYAQSIVPLRCLHARCKSRALPAFTAPQCPEQSLVRIEHSINMY